MPKYEVTVTNTKIYSTTIDVEADDEIAAETVAIQVVEANEKLGNPDISWHPDEDSFEVENVDEIIEDAEEE